MKEALRAFWTERTERERLVIGVCSAFIALAIAYAHAWLPVTRERDRLLARVPELRVEAQAMERDVRELEKLKAPATSSISLKATIEQAIAASRLADAVPEIVQQDPAKVRVTIASAHAEQALGWIARLQSVPGIRLESIRLTSLGDGDRLQVQALVLTAR